MRLQKIQRSQAVRKTGTVKKKPAMKRTLNQLRRPLDMLPSRIAPKPRQSPSPRPRALVTGGAVRLGRAIALLLGRSGMDVAIGYHRSARQARRTVRDLGGLDVLVNSAARFERTPFAATTPARYARLLDLNLRGAFFCAQAAARVMAGRGGRIVNLGDADAGGAWPAHIPYALSKAGVATLTRGLAAALRGEGIAVNCVAPGPVLRPRGFPRARWQRLTRGRAGSPADVAAAVLFFATCPRYISGQILNADGGGAR